MIIIPGQLIALLTFPGVIVHEIAHQLFCRWFGVAVFDVCYFRFGNPVGYVVHEPPRTFKQSFFISVGPLFVNTFLGAMIAFPAMIPVGQFEAGTPLDYVIIWLGVSIAMHAFPSTGDAMSLWRAAKEFHGGFLAKIIAAPVVGMIYLCALGRIFWLDAIFGVAVCWAIPTLLVYALS
ncbi:MAG TPA: metalloprotease family protein [Pirellulales bacterium]|jgi:hypothetical protein|nr:metalloprotease family protein [Pirellulales bacterium]